MLRPSSLLLLLSALPLAVPVASENRVQVTTESSAYCSELQTRVAAHPGAALEQVRNLAEEGQKLCESGHVRTGIAKLRRALRAAQGG